MPAPGEAHLVYSLSLSLFSLSKKGGLYYTAPHRTRLSITQTVYSLSQVLSSLGFASLAPMYLRDVGL